ncbi:MAG: sulfite exporter TauE/SafE family protein [Planctomycetes bacterium]|nr:sulfite exporter TauE/SafE family protein [Planctomycetota bacterium]
MTVWPYIVTGFLLGLAHAAHCAGMCGAFAVQAAGLRSGWTGFLRFLAWWSGKTFAYLFVGTLAGLFGARLVETLPGLQGWIGLATGALILVAAGRAMTGSSQFTPGAISRLVAPVYRGARKSLEGTGPFAFGILTGLLPCGPVWIAALHGGGSGSALACVATMTALSVGTLPVLLAVSLAGQGVRTRAQLPLVRASTIGLLLIAGGLAIWRSSLFLLASQSQGVAPCCH